MGNLYRGGRSRLVVEKCLERVPDNILKLSSHWSTRIMEGKLKILETNPINKPLKKMHTFIPYFSIFRDFYCEEIHLEETTVLPLGYLSGSVFKGIFLQIPIIGTVLHWHPPDLHVIDTDPSLSNIQTI